MVKSKFAVRPSIRAQIDKLIARHELGHLIVKFASKGYIPNKITVKPGSYYRGLVGSTLITDPITPSHKRHNESILVYIAGFVGSMKTLTSKNRTLYDVALTGAGGQRPSDLYRINEAIGAAYNNGYGFWHSARIRDRETHLSIGQKQGMFAKTFTPSPVEADDRVFGNVFISRRSRAKQPATTSPEKPPFLKPIPSFKPTLPPDIDCAKLSSSASCHRKQLLGYSDYLYQAKKLINYVSDDTYQNMVTDLVSRGGEIEGETAISDYIHKHIDHNTLAKIEADMAEFTSKPVSTYHYVKTLFPQYLKQNNRVYNSHHHYHYPLHPLKP